MNNAMNLLAIIGVAVAGAAGALSRWGIDLGTQKALPRLTKRFPGIPIALVNMIGGVLVGIAYATVTNPQLYLVLATGFLGGFTTFSTAMLDGVKAARAGRSGWALVLVAGTLTVTILATGVGIWLGNTLLR